MATAVTKGLINDEVSWQQSFASPPTRKF